MLNAWVIAIGDEVLSGRVINWNSYWIAKRLTSIGIDVKKIICIPDDKEEIVSTVREALSRVVSYIFTTGGLGPTPGDITVESVSVALNRKPVLSSQALEYVRQRYETLYRLGLVDSPEINEARKKMAIVPEGAYVVYNDVGVAPGIIVEHKETKIVLLPGVPSEAMYLFEKIVPMLEKSEKVIVEDVVDIADESIISAALKTIRSEFRGVNIKTYPIGFGQRTMKVIAIAKTKGEAANAIKKLKEYIENLA